MIKKLIVLTTSLSPFSPPQVGRLADLQMDFISSLTSSSLSCFIYAVNIPFVPLPKVTHTQVPSYPKIAVTGTSSVHENLPESVIFLFLPSRPIHISLNGYLISYCVPSTVLGTGIQRLRKF